jgi:hypothetical protein
MVEPRAWSAPTRPTWGGGVITRIVGGSRERGKPAHLFGSMSRRAPCEAPAQTPTQYCVEAGSPMRSILLIEVS